MKINHNEILKWNSKQLNWLSNIFWIKIYDLNSNDLISINPLEFKSFPTINDLIKKIKSINYKISKDNIKQLLNSGSFNIDNKIISLEVHLTYNCLMYFIENINNNDFLPYPIYKQDFIMNEKIEKFFKNN